TPRCGATATTPPPSSAPRSSPARSAPRSPSAARLGDTRPTGGVPDWQLEGRLLMRPSPRDSYDHRRPPAALPLQRAATMTRFVSVTVLVLLVGGGIASAQGTGSGSGTLPG